MSGGEGVMMFETHPTIFMFLEFIGLGLLLFSLVVIPVIQTSYQNEKKKKIKCLRLSLIFLLVLTIGNLILGFLPFVEETQVVKSYSTPSFTVSGNGGTVIVTAREKNHHKKEKFIFNENLELMNHKWDEDSGKLTLSFNEEETDNPNSRGAKYNFYKINKELRYKKQDYCLIYQKVKVKHLNGFEWFFETYFNQKHLKKNLRTEVNITIQKGLMYNNQK